MKKKRFTPAQREAMFVPTWFFGYGSLMQSEGINGRSMIKKYKDSDVIPCRLNGFKRSMCGYFEGRNFYGLLENKLSYCNGVVFKVDTWYDYRGLLMSEGATSTFGKFRTYWPINVTNLITDFKVPAKHRVVTLLCKEDKSKMGRIEARYISICHKAAVKLGPRFEAEFLITGGVPYNRKRRQLAEIVKQYNGRLW